MPDGKMLDRSAAKVKSDEPELWLRLVRAPKWSISFAPNGTFTASS